MELGVLSSHGRNPCTRVQIELFKSDRAPIRAIEFNVLQFRADGKSNTVPSVERSRGTDTNLGISKNNPRAESFETFPSCNIRIAGEMDG